MSDEFSENGMDGQDGPPRANLAHELNALLRRMGSESSDVVAGVFGEWGSIVGEHIAAHVTPVMIKDARLVVSVDDPAWATQTKFLESEIAKKVSAATKMTIHGIEVRIKRPGRNT
jgi:predicted nucleic acid-binding Zn ribbon protein